MKQEEIRSLKNAWSITSILPKRCHCVMPIQRVSKMRQKKEVSWMNQMMALQEAALPVPNAIFLYSPP
jgi:hypothetical protein